MRSAPWVVAGILAGCSGEPASEGATDGTTTSVGSETSTASSPSVDATTQMDTTGSQATGDTSGTTGEVFELDVHTLIGDDGRLALSSNLPPTVVACEALRVDAPCGDEDQDGLVDAWEDVVLERLRPVRRMDEAESFFGDAEAVAADVGRVAPIGAGFHVYVMLGYSRDYGSCMFKAHNGDSERVALALDPWPDGGLGGVVVAAVYTAAHEGSVNNHGRVVEGAEVAGLVVTPDARTNEPRWVVYPSADKHATYSTIDICEGISVVPCVDEDCGPDGVSRPADFDLLPAVFNAGEDDARLVDDLTDAGFPGDSAWDGSDFCGGLGGSGCSSPVRDKLTIDPF